MGVTILRNASVLDPERGELAPGQSVVIEGGRIADIGPGLTGPPDSVSLDVAGRTVTATTTSVMLFKWAALSAHAFNEKAANVRQDVRLI